VLLLLLLAYIFNFVDRQIIGVLAVPIKAELQLSDRQLGLMGGVAIAIFYSTLAIPIAWLADRKSRIAIISASVALWSLFTALCGFAQNFWQLFLARMGVGIGEAGGVAPSYSLIADYFPPASRARALAVFSFGIPIGSALGIYFGGWIASSVDWRTAFIVVGLAGIPAALLLKLFVPEPKRGATDAILSDDAPPFLDVAKLLARNPSFWLLSLGAASGSIMGYGLIFWLPSFFARSFGLGLNDIGWFYGSIVLVGGMLGIWLGGVFGDRLGAARPSAYALIPALCFLVAAPLFAAGLFAPSLGLAWVLFVIPQMLALAWLGPVLAAIQRLVPSNMRSTASASFLLINNLIGIGLGVWIIGEMSTRMEAAYGDQSLRYSVLFGLSFYLLSALFYLVAAGRLSRDVYEPPSR
jgi:predicted MFS family arabinose efflux permease